LKGEELEETAEEENPNERWQPKQPVPVEYNARLPVEYFDLSLSMNVIAAFIIYGNRCLITSMHS
jgi:hypothetical protein